MRCFSTFLGDRDGGKMRFFIVLIFILFQCTNIIYVNNIKELASMNITKKEVVSIDTIIINDEKILRVKYR